MASRAAAAAHWVAVGAKLVVERNCLREFYPAAFSLPVASVAALGTFAAALSWLLDGEDDRLMGFVG